MYGSEVLHWIGTRVDEEHELGRWPNWLDVVVELPTAWLHT
jgi:hypothetical protein